MVTNDSGRIPSGAGHLCYSVGFLVTWSNVKLDLYVQHNETNKQILKMLNISQINSYKTSYPKAVKHCYMIKNKQHLH